MKAARTTIDISNQPELLRLAEEVNATKQPRILKRDSEPVAMLVPVGTVVTSKKPRGRTNTDYATFLSAFGSWNEVDTEKLKKDIYETRKRSLRPAVRL